jgi:hypothetical protein
MCETARVVVVITDVMSSDGASDRSTVHVRRWRCIDAQDRGGMALLTCCSRRALTLLFYSSQRQRWGRAWGLGAWVAG